MAWEQSPLAERFEIASYIAGAALEHELPEDDGVASQALRRAITRLETLVDGEPIKVIVNDLERELHALGLGDKQTDSLYGDIFEILEQVL